MMVARRSLVVVGVTPEIAMASTTLGLHGDPADRLIAATAVVMKATLLTKDGKLRQSELVPTLW